MGQQRIRIPRKGISVILILSMALLLYGGAWMDQNCRMVACVGDSITYGVGAENGRNTYPALLQEFLGKEYRVRSYGVQGRALLKDSRFPYTREKAYWKSLKAGADIYIILLGSNDIWEDCWDAGEYQRQLEKLVEDYRAANEESQIFLVQPPAYFPGAKDVKGQEKKMYMPELCSRIAAVAEEKQTGLIDLYHLTEDHPEWFSDEVHPNDEGYRQIAAYIYECIR